MITEQGGGQTGFLIERFHGLSKTKPKDPLVLAYGTDLPGVFSLMFDRRCLATKRQRLRPRFTGTTQSTVHSARDNHLRLPLLLWKCSSPTE